MNTKTILNIAAFALMAMGIALKASYIAGGTIAIILSSATMLYTIFMFAIKDNKDAGLTDGLNYVLIGTMALWIIGSIFKIQHWPGAGIFGFVGIFLGIILPIILILQNTEFKISKQFLITFCILFMLITSVFIRNNPVVQLVGKGWDYPMEENGTPVNTATDMEAK